MNTPTRHAEAEKRHEWRFDRNMGAKETELRTFTVHLLLHIWSQSVGLLIHISTEKIFSLFPSTDNLAFVCLLSCVFVYDVHVQSSNITLAH